MNIFKHIIILLIAFTAITSYAQKVSNITFRQEQSTIIVSYDLETKTPCKVSLYVSTNGGTKWQGPLTKVTGDVGNKIVSGSHHITWNVLEELEELKGDNIKFQVKAIKNLKTNLATVIIGNQEWTKKNLNVSRYRNGDIIPEVTDPKEWKNLTTGAWCYYNNDPKNGVIYGKLYNWYAVNDFRGLAPEGFHIPSYSEMTIVKSLKSNSGFLVQAGGGRYLNSTFDEIGNTVRLWSSTDENSNFAWYRNVDNNSEKEDYGGVSIKQNGFSVRCIKD